MLDINTLAAWGEFLGGVGVIASLIYLAGQIRQNSRLLMASTASATSGNSAEFLSLVVQDSEIARIFEDGQADRSSLPAADRRRFDPLIGLLFAHFNEEYPN